MGTRRPGVNRIGNVIRIGMVANITGWGLSSCMSQCSCHLDPGTGQLDLLVNGNVGDLGLRKHRACHCCEPWTATELESLIRQLAEIEALTTIEEQPS